MRLIAILLFLIILYYGYKIVEGQKRYEKHKHEYSEFQKAQKQHLLRKD